MNIDEVRNNAYEFVKDHKDDSDERQQAQSWVKDFLEKVFSINNRKVNAGFEWRVKKGSNQQYIDHLLNGMLLIEMKSRGKSLEKAKSQAYNYVMKLKNEDIPKYVMLCDFDYIRLYNLDTNQEMQFKVEDLPKNIDVFNFLIGKKIKVTTPQSPVNAQAAKLLETLHYKLREMKYPRNATELLMTRIVFCMFADDTGIFEKDQFFHYILNNTSEDGKDLVDKLANLFVVLNTPEDERYQSEVLSQFRYINGGLFTVQIPAGVQLNKEVRDMLLSISRLDWSQVSPIIFGSMFEGAMDEEKRHDLGAHFTSEINIMKVIDSLFLDDLNEELEKIQKLKIGRLKRYNEFHEKLAQLKFLDPACGSGNFLILAYREIRRLEHEVIRLTLSEEFLQENKGTQDVQYQNTFFSVEEMVKVEVNQLYGIEIERYAVSIAKLGLWLMDHLMNLEASNLFGQNFSRLPLHAGANIYNEDALKIDWNDIVSNKKVDYILGNPPFLGNSLLDSIQRDNLDRVANVLKKKGHLDFVAGWYIKAAQYITNTQVRVALVSTNSISQGEQATNLFKYVLKQCGNKIDFAHQTFKWDNNGAQVYVVIVGFSSKRVKTKRVLFEYDNISGNPESRLVKEINQYLIPSSTIFVESTRKPLSEVPKMIYGSKFTDGGHLILDDEERQYFIFNNPGTEQYIRPFIGSKELINNISRWAIYIPNISPKDLKSYPLIGERVKKVRESRISSTAPSTRKWADQPTKYKQDNTPDTDVLVVPRVATSNREYHPIAYVKYPVVVSDSAFMIPNASLHLFSILQSKMHNTWLNTVAGRLKGDVRYSNTIVYNNYIFPDCTSKDEAILEVYGNEIIEIREKYTTDGNTLADIYDKDYMPFDLRRKHQELDNYVDRLYRSSGFADDNERILHLFERYKNKVMK